MLFNDNVILTLFILSYMLYFNGLCCNPMGFPDFSTGVGWWKYQFNLLVVYNDDEDANLFLREDELDLSYMT